MRYQIVYLDVQFCVFTLVIMLITYWPEFTTLVVILHTEWSLLYEWRKVDVACMFRYILDMRLLLALFGLLLL